MDDLSPTNPAAWLLQVWKRIPPTLDTYGESSGIAGWNAVFGKDPNDRFALSALSSVQTAVEDSTKLVTQLSVTESRKTRLLSWKEAFDHSFDAITESRRWRHVCAAFTADRLVHLEYCAEQLEEVLPNRSSYEDIRQACAQVDSTLSQLLADKNLEPDFKLLIGDLLETLRRSLYEYELRGSKGVFDSISSVFSTLVKYKDRFNSEHEKKWWGTVRDTIGIAADIVTVTGVPAVMIGTHVTKLLPF